MRALARILHRWLGLIAAIVLFVSGATGALLTAARSLDRTLNDELYASGLSEGEAWPAATLDSVADRLRAEFPDARLIYKFPRSANESLQAHVLGNWHGEIFFDAAGSEIGRRGDREGFFNYLFELHSSLLGDGTGKAVLFAGACAYLLLLMAGILAWWPRRILNGFRLELRRGARRATLDSHRVGGALLGLVLLVSVASGAFMAYRPLSLWVARLAGSGVELPPSVSPAFAEPSNPLRLSGMIEIADAVLPGGRVSMVDWAASRQRAIRVRKQLPDEVHPNGLSSIWLHPDTGVVLRVTPWRHADPAVRAFEYIYPLHIGQLGGTANKLLAAVMGLLLAFLAASGPWLWLSRRATHEAMRWSRTAAGGRAEACSRHESR